MILKYNYWQLNIILLMSLLNINNYFFDIDLDHDYDDYVIINYYSFIPFLLNNIFS